MMCFIMALSFMNFDHSHPHHSLVPFHSCWSSFSFPLPPCICFCSADPMSLFKAVRVVAWVRALQQHGHLTSGYTGEENVAISWQPLTSNSAWVMNGARWVPYPSMTEYWWAYSCIDLAQVIAALVSSRTQRAQQDGSVGKNTCHHPW